MSDPKKSNDSQRGVDQASLRSDGKTDNYWVDKSGDSNHGHAVVTQDGEVSYLRDTDGTVLHDDSKP